jgi:hypothetical protein
MRFCLKGWINGTLGYTSTAQSAYMLAKKILERKHYTVELKVDKRVSQPGWRDVHQSDGGKTWDDGGTTLTIELIVSW